MPGRNKTSQSWVLRCSQQICWLLAVFLCIVSAPSGSNAEQSQQKKPMQADTTENGSTPSLPTVRGKGVSYSGTEFIEADVHTRSVAVTSGFSGTEIVVFGAIERSANSKQPKSGFDVIVIVESHAAPLLIRRKSRMAGIWINTESHIFENVPTFYAIASTRPLNEIADKSVLKKNAIGLESLAMPARTTSDGTTEATSAELPQYKEAIIRLKGNESLYQRQEYGVTFLGASLFRATIDLPVNVPVGPLSARVFLFGDGKLLAEYSSRVLLQREGLERIVHDFAFQYPFFYGLCVVILAMLSGIAASAAFGRTPH